MESADNAKQLVVADVAPSTSAADADKDRSDANSSRKEVIDVGGDKDFEPHVGMEFVSKDAAKLFYNAYGLRVGFATRMRWSRRSKKDHEFTAAQFVCCRAGFTEDNPKSDRRRSVRKIGCQAMMKASRTGDGIWIVDKFVKEHNHELVPNLIHLHPSKNGNTVDNSVLAAANGGLGQMKTFAAIAAQRSVRGDAQTLYEFFMHMQQLNPAFFYAMDFDEDNRLRNVFWMDVKSRMDCSHFTDVVTFDTTYLANKYTMPLASIVGVNHHRQSVLLGCALISNGTTESFIWVLNTWLRASGGQPPKAIITDQDVAIKAAVVHVFPEARHRYCLWHVLQKVTKRLGHIIRADPKFRKRFDKCIYDTMKDDDFERRWRKMIEKSSIEKDDWLQLLYEDRHHWVPLFLKDTFCAGMSTFRRNESVTSFFDSYVTSKTSLTEFVEQYEEALKSRCEAEAEADFRTLHTIPALKTPSPFESHLSSIYTRDVFMKFQVEVSGLATCYVVSSKKEGEITTYVVTEVGPENSKTYEVLWDQYKAKVSCVCGLFEFDGYLCRHVMCILQILGHRQIPSEYILRRWTMDARSMNIFDLNHTVMQDNRFKCRVQRFNYLCQQSIKFSEEASASEESFCSALHVLQDSLEKFKIQNDPIGSLARSRAIGPNNQPKGKERSGINDATKGPKVNSPFKTTTGRAPKRTKGGFEKTQAKIRSSKQAHSDNSEAQIQLGAPSLPSQSMQQSLHQMSQFHSGASILPNQGVAQENLQLMSGWCDGQIPQQAHSMHGFSFN